MGRLLHTPRELGTKDGICTYMMRGQFFVRTASSLSAERVKEDERFEKTRAQAEIMARASRIASTVYELVPPKSRSRRTFYNLTSIALRLVKDGVQEDHAIVQLKQCI